MQNRCKCFRKSNWNNHSTTLWSFGFEIQQRTEQVLNDKRCKCTIKQLDSVNSMLVLSETTRQCKLYVSAIRAIINIHCIKDIKLQHLHTAMLAGAVF